MYSLYAVRGRVSERCFKTVALFMQSPYHLKHHRVFQYQRFIVGKEDDAVRMCHDLHGDISFKIILHVHSYHLLSTHFMIYFNYSY